MLTDDQVGELLRRVSKIEELIRRPRAEQGAPSARVFNNAALVIPNAAGTVLTFNSERWDDASFHSTSINTERLTVPVTGRYLIGASVRFDLNGVGLRQIYLDISGGTPVASVIQPAVAGQVTDLSIVSLVTLAAADYARVIVSQTSGGNLNVAVGASFSPEFWIIGPL